MTRWARILEKGLSTPRNWPLGVQFEGGERGALVDKVKKKNKLSIIILSAKFDKRCIRGKVLRIEEKTFSCTVSEWN